jgi:serine/threonine-protein kinase HipA
MTVPAELTVLLDGNVVGSLSRMPEARHYRLRYTRDWVHDPGAYPVSLALPLAAPEHEGLRVRHWLRGLLPDNEARLREIETQFGTSRDDPYAMLAHVGEDCVGAVQFATQERAAVIAAGHAASEVEWLDDAAIESLLRRISTRTPSGMGPVGTGQFSLPGALGKVALVWDADGARWGLPSGRRASTHILKPPMEGVERHNENEHFCLQLARSAGLSAANSRVMSFGRQRAIVLERYDRWIDPSGEVRRRHQEDMAQPLGLDPALKYAAESSAGIREVVGLLRDYAPGDVRAFILQVGFAWITAGTDAHLRNFSLLIDPGGGATQAPLYDVASALGLRVRGRWVQNRALPMAMAIGGHTLLDHIGRDAWIREVQRSRLPKGMLAEVAELAATVADVAPAVAERLGEEDRLDPKYLRRLARSVAARAARCAAELGPASS